MDLPKRGSMMANFVEVPVNFDGLRAHRIRTGTTLTEVEVHTTNDPGEVDGLLTTVVNECERTADPNQKCAYFCSALLCCFPELEEVVVRELEILGLHAKIIDTAAKRDEIGFVIETVEPSPVCLMYLTQSVLLLYKNISEANYRKYMTARTLAIRALLDINESVPLRSAYSLPTAKVIRAKLGSKQGLKKELLGVLMAGCNASEAMRIVCNYILGILSWTDMAYMVFIAETLLRTMSPVLRDPRLQQEVANLAAAYKKINSHSYPQYFRIMASPAEARCMEGSKFPTIIALARSIKGLRSPTVAQFVAPTGTSEYLIGELLVVHDAFVRNNRDVNYLTDFGDGDRT